MLEFSKFDEKSNKDFLKHTKFRTMIAITFILLLHYEKVFFLTNIWIIGKNLIKRHYL